MTPLTMIGLFLAFFCTLSNQHTLGVVQLRSDCRCCCLSAGGGWAGSGRCCHGSSLLEGRMTRRQQATSPASYGPPQSDCATGKSSGRGRPARRCRRHQEPTGRWCCRGGSGGVSGALPHRSLCQCRCRPTPPASSHLPRGRWALSPPGQRRHRSCRRPLPCHTTCHCRCGPRWTPCWTACCCWSVPSKAHLTADSTKTTVFTIS